MGVYKRKDSWYLDFFYKGQRYTECIGPVSKTVAKEILAKRKAEVIEGRYNVNQIKLSPTFDNFMDQYLETFSKENKKPRSYGRDITSSKHLKRFFGNKRLNEITAWLMEKYKAQRKQEGVTPRTINIELSCLRHVLNTAIKWGKITENPFTKKEVKLLKENNERMRILSKEEEKVLLEAIRTSHQAKHLEPIIITALNTGMRKGEILNLKWNQVDFNAGYILVTETKNGQIRKIPVNETLTMTLKSAKRDSNPKGEYVFCNKEGEPFGDIKTGFWAAIKKAGLDGFRFHDLRHTFASRLVMAGVDLATVKELMGHKDIKMTMRYSHPVPEHKKAAVKLLDEVTTIFTPVPKKVISLPAQSLVK